MNMTTQKTLTLNLDNFQKLLLTTRTFMALNTDVTSIGKKTYMTEPYWSTNIFTKNLMIELKVTTW